MAYLLFFTYFIFLPNSKPVLPFRPVPRVPISEYSENLLVFHCFSIVRLRRFIFIQFIQLNSLGAISIKAAGRV